MQQTSDLTTPDQTKGSSFNLFFFLMAIQKNRKCLCDAMLQQSTTPELGLLVCLSLYMHVVYKFKPFEHIEVFTMISQNSCLSNKTYFSAIEFCIVYLKKCFSFDTKFSPSLKTVENLGYAP